MPRHGTVVEGDLIKVRAQDLVRAATEAHDEVSDLMKKLKIKKPKVTLIETQVISYGYLDLMGGCPPLEFTFRLEELESK